MVPIVCVTLKEYQKAKSIFDSCKELKFIPADLQEHLLAETIKSHKASAAVLGVDQYKDELYTALPKGGIILRFGVGHDGVDKKRATEAGLFVTNTPGALDDSVAEHAILLMGSLARQIPQHYSNMRSSQWQPSLGYELRGKNLLVVGCGKIGSKVASIASFGFGMKVIGYDTQPLNHKEASRFGFAQLIESLDEGIKQADFISLHIPSIPATRKFVSLKFLQMMKSSAYIINTSRGPIVDENALYDIISSGKIAGAGIDVFENEPYVPINTSKDLRNLPNVVLTPHVGSSTIEACDRMAECVIKNLVAYFQKNREQMDIVNKEILKVKK
jgi:lactate dehydrogenase-like 2-hydroxyacid dehydrogenase